MLSVCCGYRFVRHYRLSPTINLKALLFFNLEIHIKCLNESKAELSFSPEYWMKCIALGKHYDS